MILLAIADSVAGAIGAALVAAVVWQNRRIASMQDSIVSNQEAHQKAYIDLTREVLLGMGAAKSAVDRMADNCSVCPQRREDAE